MTVKREKAREPRTRRGAKKDPKLAVLLAALAHVPFDGFTDKVLEQAAMEAGVPRETIARLFPEGPLSLVEAFSDDVDADMMRKLSKVKLSNLKVRERIDEIYAFHTGQTFDQVHHDMERDRFFKADEAVAYGLIDRVIEHH